MNDSRALPEKLMRPILAQQIDGKSLYYMKYSSIEVALGRICGRNLSMTIFRLDIDGITSVLSAQ
jgi:hypothetical protein